MIQEEELRNLLDKKPVPVCYDGFEPSGRMHIAQGVMKCLNVNKLTKAGCHFKFWVADWFALMNNKMGGDLKKIQKVGQYMVEVWKAVGMDLSRVEFIWSSEEINKRGHEYWPSSWTSRAATSWRASFGARKSWGGRRRTIWRRRRSSTP